MKIGVFDSGIGGLSVLEYALKALPNEQFIFYADQKHVPYGEKTKEQIMGYVDEIVSFMIKQDVKAIVVACNTATSVAINEIRKKYSIPIIGMEPAVKKAIDLYGDKRVFVTATPVTVKGDKMKYLIEKVDKQHLVDLIPLPKLVRFAEQGIFDSEEVTEYLKEVFQDFNAEEYSSLVLGCTHFNYFKNSFRKVLPETVHFVDGNEGTIHQLIRKLEENDALEMQEPMVTFYSSGEEIVEPEKLAKVNELLSRLERMRQIQ
ncbi:MAG: glutamate racemase [Lachnospiraceae bacterium]|nr:glutamate racemase [Lachnospiraceae bacterium]